MDFKAVISNSGDEKLFKPLSNEIERRLPSASVEWKRSHGRSSKQVVLQASFFKFDPTQLSKTVDSASSFGTKPLLHVFWTSCLDTNGYKSKVRNDILKWQKQLQDAVSPNWLIVHVLYQEPSKSKIQLPRTSVYDKIKAEFGQKLQDCSGRCLQLWEPDKETLFTKSGESWLSLLGNLRSLLLESFGQHLDLFEERIRVMRERYANPDWPFLRYFTIHEELALIYQSIMLKEDALVQYDEVDALLSQFIINSCDSTLPIWLQRFCSMPTKWSGVSFNKSIIGYYQNLIKSGKISLLEFRNYLFARQCKLLIKNKRKWDIPSRLLEFLYTAVQEFKMLKIGISESVTACWIIITCLNFFHALESFESKDHLFNSVMAQLCDYVRQKLKLVGELTGLIFNREQSSEELEFSNQLLSGFAEYDRKDSSQQATPTEQLKLALKSTEEFKKFYLEITCKCLDMQRSVNRLHFAMVVGIDLAKFYLQHEQYIDAEPLLEKAWNLYKSQKWQTLYTDVLIPLAGCQLQHELYDRYLNSVMLLSCARRLPDVTRRYYCKEFLRLSTNETLTLSKVNVDPVITVVGVKMNLVKNKGHIGDTVVVLLSLHNELTEDICCREIKILTRHCDLNNPRSFSDEPISPRKSIFDQTDYGMSISLLSAEKTKEGTSTKEALTPTNILKRIKSHRRTWSKNRNVITEDGKPNMKSESSPSLSSFGNSVNKGSALEDNPKHGSTSTSVHDIASQNVKKTLFGSVSNGDVSTEAKSLLQLSRSKSEPEKIYKVSEIGEPSATSSISENFNSSINETNELSEMETLNLTSRDTVSENEESSIFTEPKDHLDQLLVSKSDIVLKPGDNDVELSAMITNEGRYVLQCVNCLIGNLKLSNILKLPAGCRSFFIVADPPKIAWTSDYLVDYLLTGSKQRLHVTLLNGPGIIIDGSFLEISSKSGLQFYSMGASSIQVFPLERDGKPREACISIDVAEDLHIAYMRLPHCKPYERVNIYFDVIAPVHRKAGDCSMSEHEINVSCIWLKDLVSAPLHLACIFYEPFQLECDTVYKAGRTLVKVSLCGVNPVPLNFSSPRLLVANGGEQTESAFEMLSNTTELHLFGNEKSSILWRLSNKGLPSTNQLNCVFKVDFNTKDSDENDFGHFEQRLTVPLRKAFFRVEVVAISETASNCNSCRVLVKVLRNKPDLPNDSRLFLMLNPNNLTWKYPGSETFAEINFLDNNEIKLEIILSTELTGPVAMPCFVLVKTEQKGFTKEEHVVDIFTQFPTGVVDYISKGQMATIRKRSATCTDI